MAAVRAPKGYRTFYLGAGKVVHAAQDSDTTTLCKKPITTVALSHYPFTNCTQCAKVALTINEGDSMPPKKKTEAAPDIDALISDVHGTIDQIRALEPSDEGAADALEAEAEAKIRQLPTNKRTALRKALAEAYAAATTKPEPAAAPAAEVATISDDPMAWAHVPELIAVGVEKMREGTEAGMKLTSAGETVANVLLTIRQNMVDPETGLPDLPWRMKASRNAAGKVYDDALKGVSEDDVERRAAHASLIKATQNKASDVLVDWLRGYTRDDDSLTMLGELFPGAVKLLKADETLTPEAAIRALYADHGVELPIRGRTEQMRINRRVDKISGHMKELEAAEDAGNTERVKALRAEIDVLKAELPDDAIKALDAPEKTDVERTTDAVAKLRKDMETAGKRFAKVKGVAQQRKVKAELYALIRETAETFELDLSALVPADE
ncbi:hypothetical protein [Streptomyces sp. NPDC005166]